MMLQAILSGYCFFLIEDFLNIDTVLRKRLIQALEKGLNLPQGISILHTAPHHDDILLGYYPLLKKLIERNVCSFAYLTSGFNSVTDAYMVKTLENLPENQIKDWHSYIFQENYSSLLKFFLDAANLHQEKEMAKWESLILLRNLKLTFNLADMESLKQKRNWLLHQYFPNKKVGNRDLEEIQILKGAMRESESDRKLAALNVDLSRVYHLRAKFYSQQGLTEPEEIAPFVEILNKIKPQLITVAFDPENVGPKTHTKVLHVVRKAVEYWNSTTQIWGYRNVWSRFKLSEASLLVPVSEQELTEMNHQFLTCFSTQKVAAFPSPIFEGPFSALAEKIQREQFEELKILLAEDCIEKHETLRNAAGIICLKEIS